MRGCPEHRLCGVPKTHQASRNCRAQCGLYVPEWGQLLPVCRGPCLLAVAPVPLCCCCAAATMLGPPSRLKSTGRL